MDETNNKKAIERTKAILAIMISYIIFALLSAYSLLDFFNILTNDFVTPSMVLQRLWPIIGILLIFLLKIHPILVKIINKIDNEDDDEQRNL